MGSLCVWPTADQEAAWKTKWQVGQGAERKSANWADSTGQESKTRVADQPGEGDQTGIQAECGANLWQTCQKHWSSLPYIKGKMDNALPCF